MIKRAFSTVNKEEISKFNKLSDWWNVNGVSKGLIAYNKQRVNFIRKNMQKIGK